MPGVADLFDHIQIEVGGDELVLVAGGGGDHLAAGVAEIGLAVEFTDVPGRFVADAVDGADEITVGGGVGRLLQLPEIFAQARYGGARIEDDLGAVQTEGAGASGKCRS